MDVHNMIHNRLRKKLDVLGFTQPLPLGAVPLVSAILEDLIKTTESLKACGDQTKGLLREKNAWELGVEAYKCDNSKLLNELNNISKELIRQKDHYEVNKLELTRTNRNLEMDKKYLEEHLQELGRRFEETEGKYLDLIDPARKSSNKPFISTVRSGKFLPSKVSNILKRQSDRGCVQPPRISREFDGEVDHLQNELNCDQLEMQSKQVCSLHPKFNCSMFRSGLLFFYNLKEIILFRIQTRPARDKYRLFYIRSCLKTKLLGPIN